MPASTACPCSPSHLYSDCCRPLHLHHAHAPNAETLMRSRYSAYVLQDIDYIVATTVPAQQNLLDKEGMRQWSRETIWQGLKVLRHSPVGRHHAQVEFKAYFQNGEETACHHELSAFVHIHDRWYFIDPTVPLPPMKQPCICGSGKKFKACCGQFFK